MPVGDRPKMSENFWPCEKDARRAEEEAGVGGGEFSSDMVGRLKDGPGWYGMLCYVVVSYGYADARFGQPGHFYLWSHNLLNPDRREITGNVDTDDDDSSNARRE